MDKEAHEIMMVLARKLGPAKFIGTVMNVAASIAAQEFQKPDRGNGEDWYALQDQLQDVNVD